MANAKKRWKLRPGRPRSTTARRDVAGINRGEPQVIHMETMARRILDTKAVGLSVEVARDQLAGYPLGQLLLRGRQCPSDPGSISQRQFDTGEAWARLVRRYTQMMGLPNDAPAASLFSMVPSPPGSDDGGRHELTDDEKQKQINATIALWLRCRAILQETCAIHGGAVREVLYSVCVSDLPLERMLMSSYGLLRIGLNALGRVI